jgi:hypothetical protein
VEDVGRLGRGESLDLGQVGDRGLRGCHPWKVRGRSGGSALGAAGAQGAVVRGAIVVARLALLAAASVIGEERNQAGVLREHDQREEE